MFTSKKLIVLHFTFRFMINFEYIFYNMQRLVWGLFLYVNAQSLHYYLFKNLLFFMELPLHIFQKSLGRKFDKCANIRKQSKTLLNNQRVKKEITKEIRKYFEMNQMKANYTKTYGCITVLKRAPGERISLLEYIIEFKLTL